MTNEHGMREEKARDSTAKERRRLRRPTCLRIARRSATARADGRKNWLLASCSGGLPFAVPGVDAPSSDVHAISTLCCDVWMWEREQGGGEWGRRSTHARRSHATVGSVSG